MSVHTQTSQPRGGEGRTEPSSHKCDHPNGCPSNATVFFHNALEKTKRKEGHWLNVVLSTGRVTPQNQTMPRHRSAFPSFYCPRVVLPATTTAWHTHHPQERMLYMRLFLIFYTQPREGVEKRRERQSYAPHAHTTHEV